jgi:hypothetical protein
MNRYHWLGVIGTTVRLILCDTYHAAFDANLDGVLDAVDLQLWVNAFLAADWRMYSFY